MAPTSVATRLRLRLYVSGNAPNSARAVINARAICDTRFPAAHDLEIVNILTDPQRAITDGIIVSPTLLKLAPRPVARLIGDLSDTARVLLALEAR